MRTAILLAAAALALVARQQLPARDAVAVPSVGSAAITGRVLADDEQRTPLRRASVRLSRAGVEDIRLSATDGSGQFTFTGLPAGTYTLSAAKGGFVTLSFGSAQPGMPGSPIVLGDDERFDALPMALTRGAVIAGRIIDRDGRPVPGAVVDVTQIIEINGERRRRPVGGATGSTRTNGHGEYRVHGLMPGGYMISTWLIAGPQAPPIADVTPEEIAWTRQPTGPPPPRGRGHNFAPTLFPGVLDDAAATLVQVGRGEQRLGLDFAMQYLPVTRVSGVVFGPDGRPAPGVQISRGPKRLSSTATWFGGSTSADGRFSFAGIPPGEHVVIARTRPEPMLWAMADVYASGQEEVELQLRLQPGPAVTGRVVFDGQGSPAPGIDRVTLGFESLTVASSILGPISVKANADGTFSARGLMPGAYRLTPEVSGTAAGTSWRPRSAIYQTKDLLDGPFEVRSGEDVADIVVTFSDRLGEVAGMLQSASGRPAQQLYVLVFPVERAFWTVRSRRIVSTRSGLDGRYSLVGLPAGEYYLCALTELDTVLIDEPTYLEQLVTGSITVTVREGQPVEQNLRIGG